MFFISNVTLKSLRKKSMTVLPYFLCIYGTKDIFLAELLWSLQHSTKCEIEQKWKIYICCFFFLQTVSISFSIIITWCLSNSNIFVYWTLYRAFRWLNTQTALHKVKWLAKMPNWSSWRPPLRWKSSIEDRRRPSWRWCKATGGIRVQRDRSFIAKSWNYFYNWSKIYKK